MRLRYGLAVNRDIAAEFLDEQLLHIALTDAVSKLKQTAFLTVPDNSYRALPLSATSRSGPFSRASMPPRIPKAPLQRGLQPPPSSSSPSCCHCQCNTASKQFSSSSRNATRLRRDMFRWINGAGAVFRHPLPGSTNYLNAYDVSGNLLRASRRPEARSEQNEDASAPLPEDEGAAHDTEESNPANEVSIPREYREDLIPFPLNKNFRSQPVLSEELREEIWERVTVQGKSVRLVSAELGVEMSRVGAVVRLKSVEKQWIQKVCQSNSDSLVSFLLLHYVMRLQNSISLEDFTHGYQHLQISDSSPRNCTLYVARGVIYFKLTNGFKGQTPHHTVRPYCPGHASNHSI